MTQAVSANRFSTTGSKVENMAANNRIPMVKGLGRVLLVTLQLIGFMILSTFGIWPALAYLTYMAVAS